MNMIYRDKTDLLLSGLFYVHNNVGTGHGEEAYHQAYKIWLTEHQIPFVSKKPYDLTVDNNTAYTIYPDFILWDLISVELKAVCRKLRSEDMVQLFDYLKYRGDKLGLLINMGLDRVYIKRVIYEPVEGKLCEDWTKWHNTISGDDRILGNKIRKAITAVFEQHGTGYGRKIIEKLILRSLRNKGLDFVISPQGSAYYQNKVINKSHLDCIVINNRIILTFTALFDDNQFNISRSLSFMKTLNIKWGVAVNFGKTKLKIYSLCLS